MGGGGGGATQKQDQFQSLSPWAQPYVTSILGAAQKQVFNTDASGNITGINPYTAYGIGGAGQSPEQLQAAQSSVAGFTPLQNQAFQAAGELQTPGQFGQATGAAGLGTMQALNAGRQYQQMATNPYAVGAYMNPYIENALNPALQLANQQYGIQGTQQQGAATRAGAFGGTREALMNSLNEQNRMLAANQIIGQGYNNAYNQALQNMQYGANLGLQGAQTGISGAGQLGNLGTSQLAAQQGILNLQNQYGTQQQQQQQNVINQAMQNYSTAQQYPLAQLGTLNQLIQGKPITDVTTQTQAAGPSGVSQLAGLGTAGVAGLALANQASKREGGVIKKMAIGGLTSLDNKAMFNPESLGMSAINRGIQNGIISKLPGAIGLNELETAQRQAQMANARPVQGTVLSNLEQQAAITGLPSNLPQQYADGGIIAFEGGGGVPGQFIYEDIAGGPLNENVTRGKKIMGTKEALENLAEAKRMEAAKHAHKIGPQLPKSGIPASSPSTVAKGVESLSPYSRAMRAMFPEGSLSTAGAKGLVSDTLGAGRLGVINPATVVGTGGYLLSDINREFLARPSAERLRKATTENELLGAMSGDVGLASAILEANPNNTSADKRPPLEETKPTAKVEPKPTPAAKPSAVQGQGGGAGGKKGIEAISPEEKVLKSTTPEETKSDIFKRYEDALLQQAAEAKADRETNMYMRLLQAGLGIMGGTSPYAATNVAQGAQPAAQGVMQDLATERKEDRERAKELLGLGLKREELGMEARKLAAIEKLYGAHGRYYDAAAKASGIKAANVGSSSAAGLSKTQLSVAEKLFKGLRANMANRNIPDDQLWGQALGMAKMQSPDAGGSVAGTWTPQGGFQSNK